MVVILINNDNNKRAEMQRTTPVGPARQSRRGCHCHCLPRFKGDSDFDFMIAMILAYSIFQDSSFITGQTIAVDGGRSVGIPHSTVN